MAKIIPRLDLNKIPSGAQNYGLIFAKNIRLDAFGNIRKDYDIEPIRYLKSENSSDNEQLSYDNIIEKAYDDIVDILDNDTSISQKYKDCLTYYKDWFEAINEDSKNIVNIVGYICDNNSVFLFIRTKCGIDNDAWETVDCIVKFNEEDLTFLPCNCAWSWSGGNISGYVTQNLRGETILNICEINENANINIPFKSINLKYSNYTDDESLYTQTPNVPLINIEFLDYFSYTIPNGVYQFFIRYELRENVYTDWFPASRQIFTGNYNITPTTLGSVKHLDVHKDSFFSFEFKVNTLLNEYIANYKSFQLGFIVSNDDSILARSWKHFSFDTNIIQFTYEKEDLEELEIKDFTKHIYGLYNVGNITQFKDRLYISNYTESNKNPISCKVNGEPKTFEDLAKDIEISIQETTTSKAYNGKNIREVDILGSKVIDAIEETDGEEDFVKLVSDGFDPTYEKGILESLVDIVHESGYTIRDRLNHFINGNFAELPTETVEDDWGFKCKIQGNTVKQAKRLINGRNITFDDGDPIEYMVVNNARIRTSTVDWIIHEALHTRTTTIDPISGTPVSDGDVVPITYLDSSCNFRNANLEIKNSISISVFRKYYYTEETIDEHTISTNDNVTPTIEDIDSQHGEVILDQDGVAETRRLRAINRKTTTYDTSGSAYYAQNILITFEADTAKLSKSAAEQLVKYTTLIPYQKYKFYIHYVKANGEETNGYLCQSDVNNGIITVGFRQNCNAIIYPKFDNIVIPDGYSACYFSILHYENNVAVGANLTRASLDPESPYGRLTELSIPEINLGLFTDRDEIKGITHKVIDGVDTEIVFKGRYHASSDASPSRHISEGTYNQFRYFGADGIVTISDDLLTFSPVPSEADKTMPIVDIVYVISEYTNTEKNPILKKCTPYIKDSSFDKYTDLDLFGYICNYYFLNRRRTINLYTDGSTMHKKEYYSVYYSETGTYQMSLKELSDEYEGEIAANVDDTNLLAYRNITTEPTLIYSRFNLNYLTLTEDLKPSIKSIYHLVPIVGSDDKKREHSDSITVNLYPSLILDTLYNLPSMFVNTITKSYSVTTNNNVTKFDNTIRATELKGDETSYDVYKFDAEDYYNVPTNRGHIVNLISSGNAILVHTRDSLFSFSGNSQLTTNDSEISTKESQPFDNGIMELFGSDFGYGGLQNKRHAITTQAGYFFYDSDSKRIYVYDGKNQLAPISNNIETLINYLYIEDVFFANDSYNDRIFVCIRSSNHDFVTLSFSIKEGVMNFISTHDFSFIHAFNTKTNCYFLNEQLNDVCWVTKGTNGFYISLDGQSDIFPFISEKTTQKIIPKHNIQQTINKQVSKYKSIIDVIINDDFGIIKALEYIEWVAKDMSVPYSPVILNKTSNDAIDDKIRSALMSEPSSSQIPNAQCDNIRIYTDTSSSDLLPCKPISNTSRLETSAPNKHINHDAYKYPRYNLGKWTLNYFRNVLNNTDIYKYGDSGAYKGSPTTQFHNGSFDNATFITGKYFVIRFIFSDDDFVLESVNVFYKNVI